MADITLEQLQGSLNADQKTFLETHIKTTTEAAVAKAKADAEEARKKSVPEKYEIKFSDGIPLDPKTDGEKITAYLKTQGFSNEQAAAHLKHLEETVSGVVTRTKSANETAVAALKEKWMDEVAADKDLGGTNTPATEAHLKRVLDAFAPETTPAGKAFREAMAATPYGNHPDFVRFLVEIGKAMTKGQTIIGGGTTTKTTPKTPMERLAAGLTKSAPPAA